MKRTRPTDTSRRNKTLAILAGGTLVGVAVTATLAAWTDTEWIYGGDGAGGPGVGTSTFEAELNTVAPFDDDADFVNDETNPGQAIVFGLDALALSPGDSVYAAVALRSAPDSVGGDLLLQPAVAADGIASDDPDGALTAALELRVATSDTIADCDIDAFAAGATVIADGPLATAGATAEQTLDADAGSVQYYCFEITLPDDPTLPGGGTLDDLMGLTVAPAWEFEAESF